jgi:SAM-dependent methyltransferase
MPMKAPNDWWRTFFSGTAVQMWLQATSEEQTKQEADFIQKMVQVPPPGRLLDVPCGGGRHALALAVRGYVMTGVDISSDFLNAARAGSLGRTAPGTLPATVTWEQRDMCDLPWAEEFDGAYCFGNSFGYQDEAGNADFLKAMGRALKPGGRFILDSSYIVEVILPTLQERAWYQTGDIITLADRRYDHVTGRLEVEYTWVRNGGMEKQAMSARLYSYREMVLLFEAAGFGDLQAFSSLTEEPFRLRAPRLLLVATKRRR